MENYRLEGLKRFVETELIQWLNKEHGFIKADFEVIGAIIFTKYYGEDERIDKMLVEGAKTIKDAQEFLDKLKNKH